MQKIRYVPIGLIVIAMFSGCATVLPENSSLKDAHSSYKSAQNNAQVTKLAAIELQEAGETLDKADTAWSKGKGNAAVNQLAYLAKQKVAIAEEIAKRKAAEIEIAGASAKRDQVRLEARTAEADAARKRAELAQQAADQSSVALAVADIKTEQDQALIKSGIADVEIAKKEAATAQESAEMQTATLAEVQATAKRNEALIAEQEVQLKKLQAKKTDRGLVITLGDVLFNVSKAKMSARGINNVKKLADFLSKYPQRKVMIEGHTDSTGKDSYNQALSEKRANAVHDELVKMGISSDRIVTRGYGETSPVATNNTAVGRQLNRRVEIILSDDADNIVPHDKNPE